MGEKESKNLKVSDCHTAGFTKVREKNEETGKFKNIDITICDVCRQPCKVVEMIIDSIEAE